MIHIGEIIKTKRMEQGDTQERLSEAIGVSRQTILNWEKGKTLPDSASLVKIAERYQLSFDELIGLSTISKPHKIWKKYVILLAVLSIGFVVNIGNNAFIPSLLFILLLIFLSQEYRMTK